MNEADVLEISRQTFFVILQAGGPVMLAGLVIGLVIAIFQTLTSIQEMTLTFVPKILALFAALLALLPFMSVTLATFMERVADQISAIP